MIDEKLKNDISSIATNSQELLSRCIGSLSEIDRANAKAIAKIEAKTNNLVKTFSSEVEKTIGVGGDFRTLEDALLWTRQYVSLNNDKIILVLLSNYVITEQIVIKNAILNHVIITSKNELINVDIDMLNKNNWYFAFVIEKSFINFQDIKFKALKNDIKLIFNHFSNLYVRNLSADNFYSCFYHYRGELVLEECKLSNNTKALYLYSSNVEVRKSNFDTNTCAIENMQANLACWESTFSNNSLIFNHSKQAITKIRECTFSLDNTQEANIAYNTLTPNGIIFK